MLLTFQVVQQWLRRREQNRMAQRRFRWKRSEPKRQPKRSLNLPLHDEAACRPSPLEPPASSQSPGPGAPGGGHDNMRASTSTPTNTAAASRFARLPCVYSVLQRYSLLDFARVEYDSSRRRKLAPANQTRRQLMIRSGWKMLMPIPYPPHHNMVPMR